MPTLQHAAAKAEIDRNIQRSQIIEITRSILNFQAEGLNEAIREILLQNNYEHRQRAQKDHAGILSLLEFWGDPTALLVEYEEAAEERQRRE